MSQPHIEVTVTNHPQTEPTFSLTKAAAATPLAAGTYNVRVSALNAGGEGLAAARQQIVLVAGDKITVTVTNRAGDTQYGIYISVDPAVETRQALVAKSGGATTVYDQTVALVSGAALPTTPDVAQNEIFRSETGASGSFVRIANNVAVDGLYRDYQVARARTYYYFVRAVGTNGAVKDSATSSTSVTWNDYDWLAEPDGANPSQFRWHPQPVQTVEVRGEFIEFDGRAYPLGFSGEQTQEAWEFTYMVNKNLDATDQWDALRFLLDDRRGRDLMWRDKLGNLVYVRLLSGKRSPQRPGPRAEVTFTLRRVDHSIVV